MKIIRKTLEGNQYLIRKQQSVVDFNDISVFIHIILSSNTFFYLNPKYYKRIEILVAFLIFNIDLFILLTNTFLT